MADSIVYLMLANLRLHRPPALPAEGASVASPPHACEPTGPVAPLAAGESESEFCSCCGGELAPGGACNTAVCAVAMKVVCGKCTGVRELGTGRCHNGEAWCADCVGPDDDGDYCLWCEGDLAPAGPCSTSLCRVKLSLVCGWCEGPRAPDNELCSHGKASCTACLAKLAEDESEDEGADSADGDEGEYSDSAEEVEDEGVAVAVVHANTDSLLRPCAGCASRVHRQDLDAGWCIACRAAHHPEGSALEPCDGCAVPRCLFFDGSSCFCLICLKKWRKATLCGDCGGAREP